MVHSAKIRTTRIFERYKTSITREDTTTEQMYLGIRHLVNAGVQILWRSVYLELVQRDQSVVKVDVGNTPFIGRRPVSHATVHYFFCFGNKNTQNIRRFIGELIV